MKLTLLAGGDATYVSGDGSVLTGAAALDAGDRYIARAEAEHRAALHKMTPQARRAYAAYMRTGVVHAPVQVRTTPRPRGAGAPRVRRVPRAVTRSGDSGNDDPDGPWALSFVDRAPFLWRIRALRCRLHELIAGVER